MGVFNTGREIAALRLMNSRLILHASTASTLVIAPHLQVSIPSGRALQAIRQVIWGLGFGLVFKMVAVTLVNLMVQYPDAIRPFIVPLRREE